MNTQHKRNRFLFYFGGFFIMTLGIALSVKSNLGVSPVSSIPYTLTCVWGIEMGKATILFHVALVILQILILRRRFQLKNLLQIPVGVVFGYFTTFCNYLVAFAPTPEHLAVRVALTLASTFFIAFGIFLYVPADLVPLAGEGAMLAISQALKKPFPTIKICFDVSMVALSLVTCLLLIHSLGSVGLGTVLAAFLVGEELKLITARLGRRRDQLLGRSSQFSVKAEGSQAP